MRWKFSGIEKSSVWVEDLDGTEIWTLSLRWVGDLVRKGKKKACMDGEGDRLSRRNQCYLSLLVKSTLEDLNCCLLLMVLLLLLLRYEPWWIRSENLLSLKRPIVPLQQRHCYQTFDLQPIRWICNGQKKTDKASESSLKATTVLPLDLIENKLDISYISGMFQS